MMNGKTITMSYYESPFVCMTYLMERLETRTSIAQRASDALKRLTNKQYKNGCVVDLGCGPLTSVQPFVEIGLTSVIGVDSSQAMLDIAKNVCNKKVCSLHTVKADLHVDTIPVATGVADVVVSFAVMAYLKTLNNVFTETARLLKSGGYFVFTLETTTNDMQQPYLEYMYNPAHVLYLPSRVSADTLIRNSGFRILEVESSPFIEPKPGLKYQMNLFFTQKQ